ncbi:dihydrodipicolinate synthase family protein [Nocardiopsis mangrovi]|uniref:Dihydrodipicolinate synthase family protein n=1 Tax=Nocardiopsis mangrovi TaxID=1179818 RepID=A0ABV9DV47_9ACTN
MAAAQQQPDLHGIVATVVTPFDAAGEIIEDALREEVRYLLGAGVTGICACGTTGEGETLSAEESARICDIVVQEVAGRTPVVAGIIQNSTAQVIRYGHALKAVGVDALQVTPVHYLWAPSADGTVEYYRRIGEAVDLPLVIYNVVPWALIGADTAERLADLPHVVAIKQSGGDMHLLADLVHRLRDRITILAAVDDLHLPAFLLGAQGALAAIPTITPHLSVELWEAFQRGDLDRARALHEQILPVWRSVEGPNQPALIKEALRLQGRTPGIPRHPVTPVGAAESRRIAAALGKAGLLKEQPLSAEPATTA